MTTSSHPLLPLTLDELLTTTRAVRKRLDVTRPVEKSVLEECLSIAQQAPSASNRQHWHFVVTTDPGQRAALANVYRKGRATMLASRLAEAKTDAERADVRERMAAPDAFSDKLAQVPVHVVPCIEGRTDGKSMLQQAGRWTTIAPATWSFMLAARARGLGTVWTSFHLIFEREAADLLGIPYEDVMQTALVPLAYTKGTDFKPAIRPDPDTVIDWR